MSQFNYRKYRQFNGVEFPCRTWPDRTIDKAPVWCSVDLRDGNQALVDPMSMEQKVRFFKTLLKIGFKEIEVGYPAASTTDYDFIRLLIEEDMVPDDVTLQILTPARTALIERSFESLKGAKRAIVHLYNSTSTVQREKVFNSDREGVKRIAVQGALDILRASKKHADTDWVFQYSPESFTGTEIDYAVEVCNAVLDVWKNSQGNAVIFNLPATVEMGTPNTYADQVEWFCNHIHYRESVIVSAHTHNDRGCAVAAGELAIMAGADRIEGTLLGNGERTGNMDIITMAMNLYSQGVDPELDFSFMSEVVACATDCTKLPVHPRHPYVGELVFTAFSGSHQDAIKKCLTQQKDNETWDVAYLPINPEDLGRTYEEIIRINSQSGKGGIAYVMERDQGVQMPRWFQVEFSAVVQQLAEKMEAEVQSGDIWELFKRQYLKCNDPYGLKNFTLERSEGTDVLQANLIVNGQEVSIHGEGNGVIASFVRGLELQIGCDIVLSEYSEHSMTSSANADAMAYVQLSLDGKMAVGAGKSEDIVEASLNAILSALNSIV